LREEKRFMTWELMFTVLAIAVVCGVVIAYFRRRTPGGA
jgi:hypothetical protein